MKVKVVVDLLDSSNHVIDTLYEDTVDSVMIGNIYDLPLDINTEGLAPGYYGIRATFINPTTGLVITTITREKALNVSSKVPDSSMIGIPSLAAPDELGVGNKYKGQIVVPVKVPISYSVGRKVYLDKDGTQTTIVPEGTTILNPDTPLSIDINYDTSSLVEGRYDVILHLWDSEGDVFLQADIGDLIMQAEALEIPKLPDKDMFGTPKLTAEDEVEIGQIWSGSISIPNKVLDAYPIGHRAYIRKGDVGAIISPSKTTTVNPEEADLPLSISLDTADADLPAGLYDIYLELWDINGDVFLQADIGDLILKSIQLPEVPTSSMVGLPIVTAPETISSGGIWSGEIAVPITVPKTYFVSRKVYLEKDGVQTTVVTQGPVTLNPDSILDIPFNFDTSGIAAGNYGVYLQMFDNAGNSFFLMNIFNLDIKLPELPITTEGLDFTSFLKENIPSFTAPLALGINPEDYHQSADLPINLSIPLPSIAGIYGSEKEFRFAVFTELSPDWYSGFNSLETPAQLSPSGRTSMGLGEVGNVYTIVNLKTGQANNFDLDYKIERLTAAMLLNDSTVNQTMCKVWVTIKEVEPGDPLTMIKGDRRVIYDRLFSGITVFQGIIGTISLFNVKEMDIGTPIFNLPSQLTVGDTSSGTIIVPPSPVPVSFSISRRIYLTEKGKSPSVAELLPKGSSEMTPGNSLTLPVNIDTSGLSGGDYDIHLDIWNADGALLFSQIIGTINLLPNIGNITADYSSQINSFLSRIIEANDYTATKSIFADINSSDMPDILKTALKSLATKKRLAISMVETDKFPEAKNVANMFTGQKGEFTASKPILARTINFSALGIEKFISLVGVSPPPGIKITDIADSGSSKFKVKYEVTMGLPQPNLDVVKQLLGGADISSVLTPLL